MDFQIRVEEYKNDSFFARITNAKTLMKEISLMGLSAIQKNITSNISPKNAPLTQKIKQGGNTLRDNDDLLGSLNARHTENSAEVGTSCPYAKIHNPTDGKKETVIRPKRAKYLCIPAGPETRTLFRKYGWSPREVISGLENRGYSVYRPYRKGTSKRANVIMAKKGNEKAEVIFILKKSITISARPFMYLEQTVIDAMEMKVKKYYSADK